VFYRLRIIGQERIPRQGAAVLVSNHVTFVDWLIISASSQRPIRFVMHHQFLKIPLTGRLFRDAKVIPIAGAKENAEVLDAAFDQIAEALAEGELVCLFPEGKLTLDGELSPFRRGIERIIATTPVPVLPMSLNGLWGSRFSRQREGKKPLGKLWSRITLRVGAVLAPAEVSAERVEREVRALLG
jgi:1-acyl-sn-glycerol-3-phosphate acyltransferase